MTGDAAPARRTYRTRQQAVIGWAAAVVTAGVGVVVLLLPAAHRHGKYVIAGAAFVAAVGMVRFARCSVRVSPDGVRVTNLLNTKNLAWGQIREFKLSPVGACLIGLKDGKWVSLTGIEQTNIAWLTKRQNTPERGMIDELNGLLRDHGGDQPGGLG